jgi:hypothetical protein
MKTPISNRSEKERENGHSTGFCRSSRCFACTTKRKSGVLARPNLKLFLSGAILLLVVQALVSTGQSESTKAVQAWSAAGAGRPIDIHQLRAAACAHPSAELFTQISRHYEKLGDYRRAIGYLRLADEAESAEEL